MRSSSLLSWIRYINSWRNCSDLLTISLKAMAARRATRRSFCVLCAILAGERFVMART